MPRKMAREPSTAADSGQLSAAPATPSKISQVLDLLRRDQGASLTEMVEMTGWLPHTTRAALTGLKKKGHVIDKAKIKGVTRYAIARAAAE